MRSNDDLRNTAELKTRADYSLVKKLETARLVWASLAGLVMMIAAVAFWVGNIQHDKTDVQKDLRFDRSAITKLWREVFHNELP